MGVVRLKSKGDFSKTKNFLIRMKEKTFLRHLERYGKEGVQALSSATPIDSGLTASSWRYEIHSSDERWEIIWTNSNINKGVPIAIILQYGHGTGTGGYVQGRDYINPAIQPIFDKIADDAWKEVTRK